MTGTWNFCTVHAGCTDDDCEAREDFVSASVLRLVVDALDDAIKHNCNATEHDSAGWTQEDYDAWDEARQKGEACFRVHDDSYFCPDCFPREEED